MLHLRLLYCLGAMLSKLRYISFFFSILFDRYDRMTLGDDSAMPTTGTWCCHLRWNNIFARYCRHSVPRSQLRPSLTVGRHRPLCQDSTYLTTKWNATTLSLHYPKWMNTYEIDVPSALVRDVRTAATGSSLLTSCLLLLKYCSFAVSIL